MSWSAGQFESFLFQSGTEAVLGSLRRCWASCFSPRVMSHRQEVGLPTSGVQMAVIIQVLLCVCACVCVCVHVHVCCFMISCLSPGDGCFRVQWSGLFSTPFEANLRQLCLH